VNSLRLVVTFLALDNIGGGNTTLGEINVSYEARAKKGSLLVSIGLFSLIFDPLYLSDPIELSMRIVLKYIQIDGEREMVDIPWQYAPVI
jgi:hypothetical protein